MFWFRYRKNFFRRLLIVFVGSSMILPVFGQVDFCLDCVVDDEVSTRSDHIPQNVLSVDDDVYLTGYVQSLLDMHYHDFRVMVVILEKKAHLFNLPPDERLAGDVISFVEDLPFIETVICESRGFGQDSLTDGAHSSHNARACSKKFKKVKFPFCCVKKGIWFPQNTLLFAPLVADPHQVTNGACLRLNDDVVGDCVGATFFGGDFVFLRILNVWKWLGDMDLGLQAGIFSVFDLNHPEGCLVNSDFFVSVLVTYAVDKWSWRARLWHLSSHLGDEFLVTNPTFPRLNPSDEGIDFFVSYHMNRCLRLYSGIGYIFSRDISFPEQPFYFEIGTEVRPFGLRDREKNIYAQPIFGIHLRFWEEQDFSLDQTYILGMEWGRFMDTGRKVRAFFEYHEGFSKEGQFVRDRSSYYGFKMTYGF